MAADPARRRELTSWFCGRRGLIKNKPPGLSCSNRSLQNIKNIFTQIFTLCSHVLSGLVVVKMTGVRHNYLQGDYEKFFTRL